MFNIPYLALTLWVPVVFFIFERYPLQKAIVFSFVSAWLFLPTTAIFLPGFPDWTKMTATVVSVLLCTGMKNFSAYVRIRPRWFDLPVLVYCICPLVSAITANEGAYDGFSAVLEEVFRWGIPYVIGRAFLGDAAGNRLLCSGIAIGGIAYIPICLFEIRMSPVLKSIVYGIYDAGGGSFGLRYGGYRPTGFLATGLELGWWMCCATFCGFMLWKSGAVRQVMGYPIGPVLAALGVVTIACKATGAMLQLALAFGVVQIARSTRTSLVLWAILLIPPAYCIARPTGLWTGEALVSYAGEYFGADRAQSLGFRFDQEEKLMRNALQRPVFGWARNGGFNPRDKAGHELITDGLWILVFGTMGSVGLAALNAMLILPTVLFVRKVPASDWFHADVAPVTALALLLPLFMIDNLSNAMLNPIYAIAMGSISGFLTTFAAGRLGRGRGASSQVGAIGADGFTALGLNPGDDPAVAAFDAQRYAEAIHHLDNELDDLHQSFRRRSTGDLLLRLGHAHTFRARCYARIREAERSIEEREYLVQLWNQYGALLDDDPVAYPDFAGNLNDLAWSLLQVHPDDFAAIDRAGRYAAQIVAAHPGVGFYWNTLGVARYRAGDHLAAIQALSRSVNLSPAHGSAYDFYYLALANHRLGYAKPAAAWLDRAEGAMLSGIEDGSDLASLRGEALGEMTG